MARIPDATPPAVSPNDGFVKPLPDPRTTPNPTPHTDGPAYPGNTPVANPTHVGDPPYFPTRPAVPDQ